MFRRIALASLLSLTSAASVVAQSIPTPSTWVNQRNSVLTIDSIDDKGKIIGKFVNNAPDTECKGASFDLSGKQKGGSIIVAVVFTPCKTVTVWKGKITGSTFKTRFRAAYPNDKGEIVIWRGTDVFTKQ